MQARRDVLFSCIIRDFSPILLDKRRSQNKYHLHISTSNDLDSVYVGSWFSEDRGKPLEGRTLGGEAVSITVNIHFILADDRGTGLLCEDEQGRKARMVKIGQKAPDFTAQAYYQGNFTEIKLADYVGRWVALIFYPGDFTFVCATEVSAAAENYEAFESIGVQPLTISVDSPYVHKAWMQQELEKITTKPIKFPMASDVTGKIGMLYDVFDEAKTMNHRGGFIIDPDGIVQAVFMNNPSVGRSFEEIFRMLAGLIHIRKNSGDALPCDWMPGEKVLVPTPDMVGNIHGVWTTSNMSIGKFQKSEGGSIWSSDRMRFDSGKKK